MKKPFRPAALMPFLLLSGMMLFTLHCAENPLEPEVRKDNEIWITAEGYVPETLTVAAGTTVVWVNKDNKVQCVESVKSDGPDPEPDEKFPSSPILEPAETYSHKFTTAGTYYYSCSITRLQGKVIVQ